MNVNWAEVKGFTETERWAKAALEGIERTFEERRLLWPEDPPLGTTKWVHFHYCNECAMRLIFNPRKPTEHQCPQCGKRYEGEPWDGAWRTHVHGMIAANVERAAVLARLRPETAAGKNYLRRHMLFYADHYDQYPPRGEKAGKGKIMPQCLDEAVFMITLGQAYLWNQEIFSEKEKGLLREKLFGPSVALLRPQIRSIHNIHMWMASAVATAGAILEDDALVDWAIQSEHGWERQLTQGVNDDGFWYEGSMTYHYYTFLAAATCAIAAAGRGRDLSDHRKFRRMLEAPLGLVHPDGSFPPHNDGWPGVRLSNWARFYEFGARVWPDAGFDAALAWVYRDVPSVPSRALAWTETVDVLPAAEVDANRGSLPALVFGPARLPEPQAPARVTRNFPASGMAILETKGEDGGRVRICMRSGPHGGGHDHLDRLNVDVFADNGWRAADLGTSGYGAEITRAWYRTPAAHNILVVSAQKQKPSDGVIAKFSASEIIGQANEAYPGCRMTRILRPMTSGWLDRLEVETEDDSDFDWFFHGLGELSTSLDMIPLDRLPHPEGDSQEPLGYDRIRSVRGGTTDSEWRAEWRMADGPFVRATFAGAPGTQVFAGIGDDNPAIRTLGVLVVRRRGRQAVFEARFTSGMRRDRQE